MAGVTKDATSGKYVPSTNSEWTTTMSAAGISSGNPSYLWLCQESSGSLADSIGSCTLTAAGSPTYQNTVMGWSRKSVNATDGGSQLLSNSSGNFGNTTLHSILQLAYVAISATPAATRDVFGAGGGAGFRGVQVTTSPVYKYSVNDATNSPTGAFNPGTTVRPVIMLLDRSAGRTGIFTDQEKFFQSPYSAPASGSGIVWFGSVLTTCAPWQLLYATMWEGTGAQLTDNQIRTLLQKLGWSPAW